MARQTNIKFLIYCYTHGLDLLATLIYNELMTKIINEISNIHVSLREQKILNVIRDYIGEDNEITLSSYLLILEHLLRKKMTTSCESADSLLLHLKLKRLNK